MEKTYKAVQYTVKIHHEEIIDKREPWNEVPAYDTYEKRFRIISTATGEILDDAQGYGYKTAQKAYAAYAYKIRDKSKDKEKAAKKKVIEAWMKEHKSFVNLMDAYALDIAKGSMGPNDKFDSKFVKTLLEENGLHPDFKASELLKIWRER